VTQYRLSALAKDDLSGIRSYTQREHGDQQCTPCLHDLRACFRRIGEYPGLGTASDDVRPGLKFQRQGRHLVFYVLKPYGVRILCVLHERVDRRRHEFTDDEDV